MKVLPKSSQDRSKLILLPFRVYVVAAFLAEYSMKAWWPTHGGALPGWMIYVCFGYVISLCLFVIAAVAEVAAPKPRAALVHFLFAGTALICGGYAG